MFESTEALTIAVRAAHFASSVGLFGELVFFLLIARPLAERRQQHPTGQQAAVRRRIVTVTAAWLLFVIASGALWFDIEAAGMSGLSLTGALNRETLDVVLGQTLFGRIWMLRLGLAVTLVVALATARLSLPERGWIVFGGCALLAGALLATLAWAGHANAERDVERIVHRTADVLHLLAAGAWLGALPPLAAVLATRAQREVIENFDAIAHIVARFSTLGVICVSTLAATGSVNAWYTVGTVSGLMDTHYGRLLLIKLFLFGVMFALAASNRSSVRPLLTATTAATTERVAAALRLRRNTLIECALGLVILGVVGALGITVPAMHG